MPSFEIVLIKPEGFDFVEGFREVMEAVEYCLEQLGFDCSIRVNSITGRTPIIFGAHHLGPDSMHKLPADAIIFNLEQLRPGYPWYQKHYLDLLGSFRVWDFSQENVRHLRDTGITTNVIHVPFRYAPVLTRIHGAPIEDVDVLFFGVKSERRLSVLRALGDAGLHVIALNNVWGTERDQWIARSKVVLNLHQSEDGVFEIVRVLYLLANRKVVVTECKSPFEIDEEIRSALVPCQLEDIVSTCIDLVRHADLRKVIGEAAEAAVRSPSFALLPHIRRAISK